MDTPKRDESRDRQREETLARRMGEALDKIAPGDAGECPDAELIAAYHERALNPDEIAGCETHFAACARCRKILAVLAASDDTPLAAKEVARLGELLAASRAPQETASPIVMPMRPNRFDWSARWLAPALGVAAVLAVWFAMRPPWRAVDRAPSGTLVAQAPMNEPPASVEPRPTERTGEVAAKKAPESDRTVLESRAATQPQPASPPRDALAKKSLDAEAYGRRAAELRRCRQNFTTGCEGKSRIKWRTYGGCVPPRRLPRFRHLGLQWHRLGWLSLRRQGR